MYGYLILEDAYKLNEQGYSIVIDGDKQQLIIANEELEYQAYQLEKILKSDVMINLRNILNGIIEAIGNAFRELGNALINIGKKEDK